MHQPDVYLVRLCFQRRVEVVLQGLLRHRACEGSIIVRSFIAHRGEELDEVLRFRQV